MSKLPDNIAAMLQTVQFRPTELMEENLKAHGVKRVQDMIVKTITEDEINRRADSVMKGLKMIDKLKDEYQSIKPDLQGEFTEDLQQGPLRYSTEQGNKKRKALINLEQLIVALNKATTDGDYSALDKIVK